MISDSGSILLVHINSKVLDSRQLAMLHEELEYVPQKNILPDDLKEIIDFLRNNHETGNKVAFKDVASRFDITKSTARKRINMLRDLKLVEIRKNGRLKIIRLRQI
jgi:uncharacterized membrane protein